MRRFTLAIWMLGLLIGLNRRPIWAQTPAGSDTLVFIHVYNYAHDSPSMLQAAGREATRIFDAADVASHWQLCRSRESASVPDDPGCESPTSDNEFSLRIMQDTPRPQPQRLVPDILGYAVISPEHRGVVATVLIQRVIDMAGRSGENISALLGRVMAHEIGHLVLGSNDHARTGLMRAVWKLDGSAAMQEADWRFSKEDSARMRRRVTMTRGN